MKFPQVLLHAAGVDGIVSDGNAAVVVVVRRESKEGRLAVVVAAAARAEADRLALPHLLLVAGNGTPFLIQGSTKFTFIARQPKWKLL